MSIELPKHVSENIERFTCRAWLLPKLLEWWDRGGERLFVLTGGPGTGKSMILAWLARFGPEPEDPTARARLARLREVMKAAHFCQASSRNITPQAFAESIANQLTSSVTGFAEALTATLAERVQITAIQTIGAVAAGGTGANLSIGPIDLGTLGDELSFDRAFILPLKKLYESGHGEPMLLLVDALDEALGYTGDKTLPDLISTLGDLPPQVRLLVTTRNEPRVLKFFRNVQPFDLIKDAPPNVDDVQPYAKGRLAALAGVDETTRKDFAQRLASQANGVFLYAAMVLDELLARSPSALPDLQAIPLPDGLSGLYHDFLTRELGKDEQRWFDLYEPLLGLIAVGQGEGLTAKQLTDIIGTDIRAGLRASEQYLSGGLPEGPFRSFHKSFADFLLEEKGNLDYHIDAPTMHRRIADHYWVHKGDWTKFDDYGLANLATHLYHAKQFDRLEELISQQWMHARVAGGGYRYGGFITDLMLAWQHARDQAVADIEAGKDPSTLTQCVRYALIRTSITSIFSQYQPALVKRAVGTGRWSLARALSVAANVRSPMHQARLFEAAMEARCPEATETARRRAASDALPAVRAIKDPESRAIALRALAPHLSRPEKDAALSDSLTAVQEILDIAPRIEALAALAPLLSGPEQDTALRAAVSALASSGTAMLRATPPPGLGQWSLLKALTALAPRLTGSLLTEALSAARRRFVDNGSRALALAALAPRLAGAEKQDALREAVSAVRGIEGGSVAANALVVLAPQLTGPLVAEAVSIAHDVTDDEEAYVEALAALAPSVDEPEKEKVLRGALLKAQTIVDEAQCATALEALAPQLSGLLLNDALSRARRIKDRESYAKALTALARRLSDTEQETCFREILVAVEGIDDGWRRARLLAALASQLHGPLLAEALGAAREITDAPPRATALAALAPKLTGAEQEGALRDAVDATQSSKRWGRAEVLAVLAPQLSGPLLGEVLSAQGIEDQASCASALATLARDMQGPQKEKVLRDAMAAVMASADEWERAEQLAALAPQLSGQLFGEALSAGRAIKGAESRAQALTALAERLSAAEKDAGALEALSAARNVDQTASRAEILAALAPMLTGAVKESALRDALSAVEGIEGLTRAQGDGTRAKVLARLAPELRGPLLAEALSVARKMGFGLPRAEAIAALSSQLTVPEKQAVLRDELSELSEPLQTESPWRLAQALAGLAPRLSGPLLAEALSLAHRINDKAPEAKAKALMALVSQLSGPEKQVAVAEVLSAARSIGRKDFFAVALAALAPQLSGPEKESALGDALTAARECEGDEPRAEALIALAPHLSGRLLSHALSVARGIEDKQCRAQAVEAIAPIAQDRGELLYELRRYIVDGLWSAILLAERREVYEFCDNEQLFHPPLVSRPVLDQIAMQIGEIALRWRWP